MPLPVVLFRLDDEQQGGLRWDQARLTRADLDSRRTFSLTRVRCDA
jgi:hypothetical protein